VNGYDAFLARELEEHNRRGDDADHLKELVAQRAIELGADAERFLAWIGERGITLLDIKVTSAATGKKISAQSALIAHAPAWLCELVLCGDGIDANALMDTPVQYANGRTVPADVALIASAPEWLRAELVDWLSRTSQLEDEVKASIADDERLREEDAASDRYWEAA